MIHHLRKTLISLSLNNSWHFHTQPPLAYSISQYLFSSSPHKKSDCAIPVSEYLIDQHNFSPEFLRKVSSGKSLVKFPEQLDSVIHYLEESGFSKKHLERVIQKYPRVLTSNLDNTIKPKIKILQDLGFSPTDIAVIVSSDPWVLGRSADNQLSRSLTVLKSVLGTYDDVVRVLKICACFLKYNLEKTMLPSVQLLQSLGISSSQIVSYVVNFPRFFLNKPESVSDYIRRVDEMGFDRNNSNRFLPAIVTIGSMSEESWELKLKLFRSLGFTEEDIISVFNRVPQVFSVSEKKIREVTATLLGTGKIDISFVVDHPELLICSVEGRLKPRLEVFKILESKNLLARKPSLTTICKISDTIFLAKYVLPYLDELGDVSMARRALTQ